MTYHLMDYVGHRETILRSIEIATTMPDNKRGQAAKRMLEKRHWKNFKNTLKLIVL